MADVFTVRIERSSHALSSRKTRANATSLNIQAIVLFRTHSMRARQGLTSQSRKHGKVPSDAYYYFGFVALTVSLTLSNEAAHSVSEEYAVAQPDRSGYKSSIISQQTSNPMRRLHAPCGCLPTTPFKLAPTAHYGVQQANT